MTTIKTTCRTCGDIQLTPADMFLELRPGAREGDYVFTCPVCADEQRRPANNHVVSVLLMTGVRFEVIGGETLSAPEASSPISDAEWGAFAQELAQDGIAWDELEDLMHEK